MVHNFPLGINGIRVFKGKVIFEIKHLQIDKNRTYYPQDATKMKRRAIDKLCGSVKRNYMLRSEKLDRTCNKNNKNNNISTAPFKYALKKLSFMSSTSNSLWCVLQDR